jgi:hypothetical protein
VAQNGPLGTSNNVLHLKYVLQFFSEVSGHTEVGCALKEHVPL